MSTDTTPTETWALTVAAGEQMWDAIATVRDAFPREKGDASTDDLMDVLAPLIESHARKAQAAELRRIAGFVDSQLSRSRGDRHEGLSSVWALLLSRAAELDGGA